MKYHITAIKLTTVVNNRVIPDERPGDGDPLLLSSGQLRASLAHQRVVLLWQPLDEVSCIGRVDRNLDVKVRDAVAAHPDVVGDAAVEQDRFLGDDADSGGLYCKNETAAKSGVLLSQNWNQNRNRNIIGNDKEL